MVLRAMRGKRLGERRLEELRKAALSVVSAADLAVIEKEGFRSFIARVLASRDEWTADELRALVVGLALSLDAAIAENQRHWDGVVNSLGILRAKSDAIDPLSYFKAAPK